MLRKFIYWLIPTILIMVTSISQGENNGAIPNLDAGYALQKADSLYSRGNYFQALTFYYNTLSLTSSKYNPATEFKIAYSFFKTGKYGSSAEVFDRLVKEHNFLPEYSRFFSIKSLWRLNAQKAQKAACQFIEQYNKHALADSLLIPVADQFYNDRSYQEARHYYLLAKRRNVRRQENAYLLIQAAKAIYKTGQIEQANNEFYQVLKKYPSHNKTYELAVWLKKNQPQFYKEHFFNIVDVYYRNKEYNSERKLLENYIKDEDDKTKKEKARFNLVKLYYAKGEYKTALYGFNTLLDDLKNKNLEPHIRLYFARIYIRLGQKQKAINAYLDYAKRFPRRRIAQEAVWKSAWIYEEMNKLPQAMALYRQLRQRWPRSKYAKEAFFREGFSLYRSGNYTEADQVFTEIRFKSWNDIHTNRAQYWSALCRDIKGDATTAKRLRLELAQNMWDNYYTMKSYFLHKSFIDSNWNMIQEFKNSPNPLSFYAAGFANLLKQFEEAFQVRELLGEKYGFIALSDIKLSAVTRQEWIAIAEIYKKFGAYGKAYSIYDYINRKFYGDVSYVEKSFMLKQRFPFYYDIIIEKYSKRYGLESEFILAIIKQESTYNRKAHSWANAFGLMQLIPSTAQGMANLAGISLNSNEQLFDPDLNIHLGSLYVKQLDRRFKGRKEWILAAYNAGPHRVNRWRKIKGSDQIDVFIENIEYKETRNYVRKVMKNYWSYRLLSSNFQVDDEQILLGCCD